MVAFQFQLFLMILLNAELGIRCVSFVVTICDLHSYSINNKLNAKNSIGFINSDVSMNSMTNKFFGIHIQMPDKSNSHLKLVFFLVY